MEESSESVRLAIPDVVKGLVIFGVVLTHLYLTPLTSGETPGSGITEVPIEMLYISLMVFFVVSGYFYRPRGFVYNMRKRVTKLALSFVACTLVLPIIMYGYLCTLGYEMDFIDGYRRCLVALIGNYVVLTPMGSPHEYDGMLFDTTIGYYFLNLMIFSFLLFYAIAERVLSDRRNTIVSLIVLLLVNIVICEVSPIHLPFQIELIPISVAFMVFGAYLGQRKVLETMEAEGLGSRRFWSMFLITFAVSFLLIFIFPVGRGFHYAFFGDFGGWSVFTYFLAGCFTCTMVFGIGLMFSKIPYLSRALEFIGSHTLAILLVHCLIGKMIGFLLTDRVGINSCPALTAVQALFVIPVTLMIASYLGKLSTRVFHRYL